jgi:hypothetical protein
MTKPCVRNSLLENKTHALGERHRRQTRQTQREKEKEISNRERFWELKFLGLVRMRKLAIQELGLRGREEERKMRREEELRGV